MYIGGAQVLKLIMRKVSSGRSDGQAQPQGGKSREVYEAKELNPTNRFNSLTGKEVSGVSDGPGPEIVPSLRVTWGEARENQRLRREESGEGAITTQITLPDLNCEEAPSGEMCLRYEP